MVTIRKSVPNYYQRGIPRMLEIALEFIARKYPSIQNWEDVDIVFTARTKARGKYYRNKKSLKYKHPGMFIGIQPELGVYSMKSLGVKKQWVNPGHKIATTCVLIHEFTHHAQHELGMNHGELEPVRNELEYLKSASLFDYKEIMGR